MPARNEMSDLVWLDGLRAVAVTLVIAYHAQITAGGVELLRGGFVGVDVFFVISGFLVTRSLVSKWEGGKDYKFTFWIARLRRIVPALIVVIGASGLAAFALLQPSELQEFSKSAVAALAYVSNIYFYFQDPYEAANISTLPLIHTWSLSVEAQFYIAYPFLLSRTLADPSAMLRRLVGLTLVSYVFCIAASALDHSFAFYGTPSRFWEFGVGAIVATLARTKTNAEASGFYPATGLLLIFLAAASLNDEAYRPAVEGVVPVLGTAMILAFARTGPIESALSSLPFVMVGMMSYSLYLWHQPIFAILRLRAGRELDVQWLLGALTLAFALSYLSWRYVENPFRRRRTINADRHFALVVVLTKVAFVGMAAVAVARPITASNWLATGFDYEPKRGVAMRGGKPCPLNTTQDVCVLGDQSVTPTMALLGDSHAATLAAPMSEMLSRHQRSALLMPMQGCPFIAGVMRYHYPRNCAEHVEQVIQKLQQAQIQTVIINDYRNYYLTGIGGDGVENIRDNAVYSVQAGKDSATRLDDVLELQDKTLRRILALGIRVYFVLTVPDSEQSIPSAVRDAQRHHLLPYQTDLDAYLTRSKVLFAALSSFDGEANFIRVFPHKALCNEGARKCSTHSKDRIFYTDSNHLSADGARILVAEIERVVFGK